MNEADHVALLRPGIEPAESLPVWAELGAGDGAFTLALAELLGPGATIYTIDRDGRALQGGAERLSRLFPETQLHLRPADFRRPVDLPPLDGVLAANALHFVADLDPVVALWRSYLKPGGRFLVVEYNVDRGNMWVPHPFSFETWRLMAAAAGFGDTQLLGRRPSRNLGEIYAAMSR